MIITFILRDDGPFCCMQEPPRYRSVHIELTPEQCEKLRLRETHTIAGKQFYETVSLCFVDEEHGRS